MSWSEIFPCSRNTPTSRTTVQLTAGTDFCYPLYYFIPSVTADGRYMVYHRETPETVHEIQLHRLDLFTGDSVQLTVGTADNAHWQPWGVDRARGILGDRSALAPHRSDVVYFDGTQVYAVNLNTLTHRHLFSVPKDRFPLAQNCITGDEQWFVYVHVDRAAYERLLAMRHEDPGAFRRNAHTCKGTAITAFNLDTGEHRTLFRLDYPVHHVHLYGFRGLAFSHIPGDLHGMGFTSVDKQYYSIPRPQDEHGGKIIHHVPTAAGIAYEVRGREEDGWAGICDPHTGERQEFPVLPGTNHTGLDPLGRLFFFQVGKDRIQVMTAYDPRGEHQWLDLFGSWPTFGQGQKAHFHPRLLPGRQWLQMVGGAPATETNHIFLVDVSDLDKTDNSPSLP